MCDYYITDGKNQYITTRNGVHAVSNSKEATLMNLSKASNVLRGLPKSLLNIKTWTILPVPEGNEDQVEPLGKPKVEFIDLDTLVNDLSDFVVKAEYYAKYAKTINPQLNEIELEIEDLYHYIEFGTFNAAQGYKAYKMVKDRLIKRRQLKDEQILLDSIQEKNMLTCSCEDIEKTINKLESRSYRPRVLKELFND